MRNTSSVLIALGFLVLGSYVVSQSSLSLRREEGNTAAILLNGETTPLISVTSTATSSSNVSTSTAAPTLTFSASPTVVPHNGNVTLTWASTNSTLCMSSGSWTGDRYLSNTRTFTNIVENKTYTLTCSGTGGSVTKSVSISVASVTEATKISVPVVSISISPTTGTVNTVSPSVSWSATNNPTACTASGDWSGTKPVSGSAVSLGVLSVAKTYTYILTCSNSAGSSSAQGVSVSVATAPVVVDKFPRTITLSANPTSITRGQSTTVSWSASPASSCSSPKWSSTNISGSVTVSPGETTMYSVTCVNGTGGPSRSSSVTVNVTPTPQLSTKFKVNDSVQTTASLNVRLNPSSAAKSLGTQSSGATGVVLDGPVYANSQFWWKITYANGQIGWSVEQYLTSYSAPITPPKTLPTLTLSSSAASVASGSSVTITWASTNATSCVASGSWIGTRTLSGNETFTNITINKTYTVTCSGGGGSVTKSVSVGVTAVPPPTLPVPVVSLTTDTTSGTINVVNPKLTWSATNSPTSCAATGSWSGTKPTSGIAAAQGVLNVVKNYTYTLTCSNATGLSIPVSVSVNVTAPVAPPPTTTTTQISVNTNTRYQMINGWEATAQAGQASSGFSQWQSGLMNLAANDLGINRMRIEIASGAENTVDYYAQYRAGTITSASYNATRYAWVNDNSDPNSINSAGFQFSKLDETIDLVIVPMRQRLTARGESLYLNLNYVSFGNSTSQQNPNEYAELILATFQHMQSKYGFVPNAVEVILEPDNNTIWSGWNSSTAIGQAIATTGARLAALGFRPDFIAPSVMNMGNAVPFLNQIVAVPGAQQYLKEVSYHRYSGVSDANLVAIKDRASQYGLRTSMLEHIGSGVEDLYKDLTLANVSAWQQYTLAFPTSDNGAQYYTITNNVPVEGSRTAGLRQYFKYVRNGAYRVGVSSTDSTLRPVAFTNPNGKAVLVVHVDQAKTVGVGGLPSGAYEAIFLSNSGGLTTSSFSAVNGKVSVPVNTTGILTVRGL